MEEQEDILRDRYADTKTSHIAALLGVSVGRVYAKAHALGLKKSAAFLASPEAYRLDGKIGASTRFEKGQQPWNKGIKGLDIGGHETRFKPGHRGGRAAEVYRPIGSERISEDGYLQRKINDDMPLQKRWRAVHILVWEEVNGPLPKGYAVVFKDGNKTNIGIINLELISRRELMARNTIHNLPEELKDVIRLNGVIRRKINAARHK
jgi:hypothetical protein